ncbi:MAG: DUF2325 domain-containing protein [Desulfomonile tiedjei]|nr:DUF2325 domain-containing protein [Desulfomonile tiedjei]
MNSQKKIWELQHTTICKVVGMTLDFEDLKKIGRKFALVLKAGDMDPEFAFHSAVVGMCGKEGKVARHVQKLVERRFMRHAKRISQEDNGSIIELAAKRAEDIGVPLWAMLWHAATRPGPDGESVETALFGRIHMLEHELVKEFWNRDTEKRDQKETDLQAEIDGLRREIVNLRSLNTKLEKANQSLENRLAQSGDRRPIFPTPRLPDCRKESSLRDQKIEKLRSLLEQSLNKNRELEAECTHSKRQLQALLQDLASLKNADDSCHEEAQKESCCGPSAHCLQGKRIAMIGGIDGLETHYKNLVERSGGEFCRHDGRCCRGERRLEQCIRSADLVVCPVSVNSHFGAIGVKKLCKKYGISCCFPDSAGLGSLRTILQQHFTQDQ